MFFALTVCFWILAGLTWLAPTVASDEGVPSKDVLFRLAGGQNPLILVPVYVDGKGPYEFILDTGAYRCLLSPELSASIGIRPESQQRATGAGGAIKISSAHVTSLAVGTARQENLEVAITGELSRFGEAVQSKVDGVLGSNFLKDFRVTVDYRRGVVRLARPSAQARAEGSVRSAASISFKLAMPSKPLILVPVFVNGRGPFQFVLDTGASRTTLSFDLARKLGIVAIGDRSGTGAGGQVRMLSATVDSLTVGKASLSDAPVSVGGFLGNFSSVVGMKLDGIVGNDFLSQFEVTIDYLHGALDLKPLVVR
jgi:predicted aspartyl protease